MPKKKEKTDDQIQDTTTALRNLFLGEEVLLNTDRWFLPSGNLALDYVLSGKVDGSGGYPSGIVEVHGEPAAGKSLLLAKAIAESQKKEYITILADAEGRWDYDWSSLQGVDAEKLRQNTFYPETVEEFAVRSCEVLEKLGKVVMVLDSLAILSTVQERDDVEGGEMKADQGRKAQKIKAAMHVLSSDIRKTGSLFLISNHVIAQPGSYVARKITPGGGGVPFQANVRVELTQPTPLKLAGKAHPVGVRMHAVCTKNSVVPPYGSCDMEVYFASGMNNYSGLLEIAVDLGVVEQRGAYYYYNDKAFRGSDFEEVCKSTDVLKVDVWTKPYWLI